MEEIKSVRVRVNSSYQLDLKLTLFRENNRKRKIIVYPIGRLPYMEFGNRWRDSSDNEVIDDYLSNMAKSGNLPSDYEIIQDPWEETVPKPRSFGFDPYYLNNGARVYIDWVDGTTSVGGKKWSDGEGNELKETIGGESKSFITKTLRISPPEESGDPLMMLTDLSEIVKKDFNKKDKKYGGLTIDDMDIIENVISYWKSQVPNYGDLALCEPNNEFCNLIPYKSPIQELEPEETPPQKTEESEQGKETKIKLSIVLPEELELKVKQDLNGLKVYVGDPPPVGGGFILQEDEFDNLEELDPEYTETAFDGLSEEEYNYQEDISNGQEDYFSTEGSTVPEKVDIQPVGNFDELLRLAGKLARELGKNTRVNYSNLKQGYIKGVHGLCPQGTQAVLAALTGIKGLGKISGNADWFSFKTPGTGGGNASFNKPIGGVVYFNDKIKITQKNGSWKGTYLQDPSQWQVGDVIAMGYTGGKKYGHIQVWTGYKWMSDFKQKRIQQNNVDPNTVALWRLNENGLAAVRGQSGVIS